MSEQAVKTRKVRAKRWTESEALAAFPAEPRQPTHLSLVLAKQSRSTRLISPVPTEWTCLFSELDLEMERQPRAGETTGIAIAITDDPASGY